MAAPPGAAPEHMDGLPRPSRSTDIGADEAMAGTPPAPPTNNLRAIKQQIRVAGFQYREPGARDGAR
jgi:hypothetical protein